jgi:hypothetical protein
VSRVDVCAVCDGRLGEGAGCDGWGAVFAEHTICQLGNSVSPAFFPLMIIFLVDLIHLEARLEDLRSFPESRHDILTIRPCSNQQLVHHSASKADSTVTRAFTADRSDEVGVSDCGIVVGEGEAEEVACGWVDVCVECDARFGVGIRCLGCCQGS